MFHCMPLYSTIFDYIPLYFTIFSYISLYSTINPLYFPIFQFFFTWDSSDQAEAWLPFNLKTKINGKDCSNYLEQKVKNSIFNFSQPRKKNILLPPLQPLIRSPFNIGKSLRSKKWKTYQIYEISLVENNEREPDWTKLRYLHWESMCIRLRKCRLPIPQFKGPLYKRFFIISSTLFFFT